MHRGVQRSVAVVNVGSNVKRAVGIDENRPVEHVDRQTHMLLFAAHSSACAVYRRRQVMRENRVHHLPVIDDDGRLVGIVAQSDLGRQMTNLELGQLTRATSIRGARRWPSKLMRIKA